jgi:flagellar motor switch protein FliN/FliY
MDGMLSQDEINALLSGMDLSGGGADSSPTESYGFPAAGDAEEILTDMEKDAIGEVANISLGSSTTTLYSLVNKKVSITTPVVTIADWSNLLAEYERPCVFIQIEYTRGLDGTNILVLRESDVKIITDLMMGGDGTNTDGELSELHLSAISEAMNQMMGAAATSLSTMLGMVIDISPPDARLLNLNQYDSADEVAPYLGKIFVKISFSMKIGDLVDSSIMQLYPIDFARKMVETFISNQMGGLDSLPSEPAPSTSPPEPVPMQSAGNGADAIPGGSPPYPQMGMDGMNPQMMGGMNPQMMGGMNPQMMGGMNPQMMGGMNPQMMGGMNPQMMDGMNPQMMGGMNPQMMGMYPYPGMYPPMGNMPGYPASPPPQPNVNVTPVQFQNFGGDAKAIPSQENIGLIMDVPLEVTVELGRTTKSISDILDFSPGTIIELDRIAGEPIDVLVNGKFVAKGEVVVIEESFGIRVTEIIK